MSNVDRLDLERHKFNILFNEIEEKKTILLKEFGLKTKTVNILARQAQRSGITSTLDMDILVGYTEEQIRSLPNVGQKRARSIYQDVQKADRRMRQDQPEKMEINIE